MTVTFRCDGCGGLVDEPAVEARHWLTGDEVPEPRFHWCRLCARAAFGAVHKRAARAQRQHVPVPDDATAVLPAPLAAPRPGGSGIGQVTSWLPRLRGGGELEETRVDRRPR